MFKARVSATPIADISSISANYDRVALVLQGGGALGAFQAGVYQAMVEAGLHPDWVAGISIGAINAALIAGNAPEARLDKLRAFFNAKCEPSPRSTIPIFCPSSTMASRRWKRLPSLTW